MILDHKYQALKDVAFNKGWELRMSVDGITGRQIGDTLFSSRRFKDLDEATDFFKGMEMNNVVS